MMKECKNDIVDLLYADRELFCSLLTHVVQTAPNDDPTDFVLASIGRNVGADRCYVYRFWAPGKTSMCTNTHEWCAEGIPPEIGGRQTCDLTDFAAFNALITSGRDFLFTDINAIDAGSRAWLAPQGIQSLIATPLVGAGNTIVGFAGFDFVKAPCPAFTDRIIFNIHTAANLLLTCQRLHEGNMALLDVSHGKNEYEANEREFERALIELQKDVGKAHSKHMLEIVRNRMDADLCYFVQDFRPEGGGMVLPEHVLARDGWTNVRTWTIDPIQGKGFDTRLKVSSYVSFHDGELSWLKANVAMEEAAPELLFQLNVVHAFGVRKDGDLVGILCVGYTDNRNLSKPLLDFLRRSALEFLAISYDRDCREKTIRTMQLHQQFRADILTYALSRDDIPGLIDLTLHQLLELTDCDYIALHSVDGDHYMLNPGDELKACPHRCEACSFYKLNIPPVEDAEHVIELNDAKAQTCAAIPTDCPAKSLEVVVVYREGKPWGGIALHYVNKQRKISDDDRHTLKIAADVLTLALERHTAALRLEAERDRVVEAEKTRSYFFSSVSHDIRTPLNAIIGFSELLQAGGVSPEEAKENLQMIVTSGKTLLQLINDVLDFSKMDLGKLKFSCEPTNVGEVIQELVRMFQPRIKAKSQTIVTEIPDLPPFMMDAHRFRQVLFNFIGNAVKYAGPSTIRISVVYEDGLLKTTVADNGRGVSAEKAKRLMQPFVQADIKNRSEGSGLGLAICKRIVELSHGTISIDTALGRGFAVHVEAPFKIATEEQRQRRQQQETKSAGDGKKSDLQGRILVVDDSPVNRAVLKAMLKNLGISNIELAEDGRVALDKLEKDPTFDLVLSDMWMPVMDGAELVKHIRANERLAHLKVCSITADVEARMTYKDQGFDALLLKPATIAKLTDLLHKTLNA